MRKGLFLFSILLSTCLIVSSQETDTKKQKKRKAKTDTMTVISKTEHPFADYKINEMALDSRSGKVYVSPLIYPSEDVYENSTSYPFAMANYRNRGLDDSYKNVHFNSVILNNSQIINALFTQAGTLDPIISNVHSVYGSNYCDFSFGNLGGSVNFDTRASSYKKQIKAGYTLTDRTGNNELQFTYASGMLKHDWSVVASISARFGNSLNYVDGTTCEGIGYFFSLEKRFNSSHALNLSAFGAPTRRSAPELSVQEAYDITGTHYYNPNWGFYQNEKRSAKTIDNHQPVIQLTHYYTPDEKLRITSTLTASFGRNSYTDLNWYHANDPRPDYHAYLPSYMISNSDTSIYNRILSSWQTNANVRQINWDNMYNVNQLAANQGKRAQYMLENRVNDNLLIAGTSNAVYSVNEHVTMSYGIDIRGSKQHHYKTVADLLGGSYWYDIEKYPEGYFPENDDFQYNNLDLKDKQLKQGDVFGYDFDLNQFNEKLWAQAQFQYKFIDFDFGAQIGATELWRKGNMSNGRYADLSKGRSATSTFIEAGLRLGMTFKLDKYNSLILNALYESNAPMAMNTFVSPRLSNQYVDNIKNEDVFVADLSYALNYSFVTMRLTGYFSQFKNRTKLISFYQEDLQSIVNYSLTGIDERHWGIELGADFRIGKMFDIILAGNYGNYTYQNFANMTCNAENGMAVSGNSADVIIMKNIHVAGTPQLATTLGVQFHLTDWWVTVNANYFDKIYCDINPMRRSMAACSTLSETSDAFINMTSQTRLKGQFTLDASLSKTWTINDYSVGFFVSVTNITNNKNLVIAASEQYTYDYDTHDPNMYQNRILYAFGTNFYAGLKFQF